MNDIEQCRSCRYWNDFKIENEGDGMHGACRRYPPVVVSLPVKMIEGYGDGDQFNPFDGSVFPETFVDSWCGEWKSRPGSIPG